MDELHHYLIRKHTKNGYLFRVSCLGGSLLGFLVVDNERDCIGWNYCGWGKLQKMSCVILYTLKKPLLCPFLDYGACPLRNHYLEHF